MKITLDDVTPAVSRTLEVPLNIRLDRLHTVIQTAFSWTDSHLWEMSFGQTGFGIPDPEYGFDGPLDVTDLVAVDAPEPLATFLAERGYLPKGVPLMKRILAVSGQTVCRSNLTLTVAGGEGGAALARDRAGRDLPVWQGCRR
ncbi:hypothetical protein KXW36_008653, partial [Aspergillus fumigatus]